MIISELKAYDLGDWVVHRNHGIGKIESIERKRLGGQENVYCKIQTPDSMIWLPIKKANSNWLRPVAAPAKIKQAQEVLKSAPQPLPDNLNGRKSWINKVNSNDKPEVIAELLRDLRAFKKEKKTLAQAEEAALRHFTDCFVAEWAVSMDITMDEASQKFEKLIEIGHQNHLAV